MQRLLPSPVAGKVLASTLAATNRGETGLNPQSPADPATVLQGRKGLQSKKPCRTSPHGKRNGKIKPFPAARLAARFRSSSSHTVGRSMLTDICERREQRVSSSVPRTCAPAYSIRIPLIFLKSSSYHEFLTPRPRATGLGCIWPSEQRCGGAGDIRDRGGYQSETGHR